jgi:hypothetical protein
MFMPIFKTDHQNKLFGNPTHASWDIFVNSLKKDPSTMTVKKRCCVSIQPHDQYGIERMNRSPNKTTLKRVKTEERHSFEKLPKIVREAHDPYEVNISRNFNSKV